MNHLKEYMPTPVIVSEAIVGLEFSRVYCASDMTSKYPRVNVDALRCMGVNKA